MTDEDKKLEIKNAMLWGALDQLHAVGQIILEQGLGYQNRKLLERYLSQASKALKKYPV